MPKGQNARPFLFTKIIEECYNKIGGANMLIKTERKPLDFSVFPQVIRDMSEDNSNASAIIDNLIDLKGESNSLATLILLDDMNIRGIQIYILYKLCGENIDIFYNKITDITKKEFVTFIKCTGTEKGKLYILSGKDFDKFIDYIRQNSCLIDFRRKPAKFLNKKPLSLKIHEAHEKLKNKKLL